MTTEELINYIKQQLDNGFSKDLIIEKLKSVGWKEEDIEEGFQINSSLKNDLTQKSVTKVDPYRELTDEQEEILSKERIKSEKNKIDTSTDKKEEFSGVWTPIKIKPMIESIPKDVPLMTASSFKDKKAEEISNVLLNVDNNLSKDSDLKEKVPIRSVVFDKINSNNNSTDDVLNKDKEKKNKSTLWMVIFLTVLIFLGGLVFLGMKGYIDIPFVKKDPRTLILNNEQRLASLSSYKTETSIKVLTPSFANITNGLATGEQISSLDEDNITILSKGNVNQSNGQIISENMSTISSSLLENVIETNIKSDGQNLYITIPDLSEIMKGDALPRKVVSLKEGDDKNIINLLPEYISQKLVSLNTYKILKEGLSSYLTDKSLSSYNKFVNNVSVVEKGKEVIKGIETYHYDVNTDTTLTKELINEIFNNFFSENEDNNLVVKDKDILNSIKISSFEIWIGKDDNNIYQYKINLSIPLSKILDLEDSSLGNNEVHIEWVSTYYDFDIKNEIVIPQDYVDADTFIKQSDDIKLKNNITKISSLFGLIKNSEGSYGKLANTKGSCINPVSGSLFSPVGHAKGAMIPVGDTANAMTKILNMTNNVGYCYSNSSSWAIAFPLKSKEGVYYCLDNLGGIKEINTELKNIKCPIETIIDQQEEKSKL